MTDATGWDDYDPDDYWDDHETPEEYEAAQLRAGHRSLLAALRLHRSAHRWSDEPPF